MRMWLGILSNAIAIKLKDSRNTTIRTYETFLRISVRIEGRRANFLVYPIHTEAHWRSKDDPWGIKKLDSLCFSLSVEDSSKLQSHKNTLHFCRVTSCTNVIKSTGRESTFCQYHLSRRKSDNEIRRPPSSHGFALNRCAPEIMIDASISEAESLRIFRPTLSFSASLVTGRTPPMRIAGQFPFRFYNDEDVYGLRCALTAYIQWFNVQRMPEGELLPGLSFL